MILHSVKLRRSLHGVSLPLLVIAGLLLLWEILVSINDVPKGILPPPSKIMQESFFLREQLMGHALTTMTEAVVGLVLAALLGTVVAGALASLAILRKALLPILVISQNIPMMILAPLIVVWFGFGIEPKIAVVTLVCFFPIAVSSADALMNADKDLLDLMKSMGASRLQVLRYVRIPQAVPSFFSGLQIAATYAVLGAVFAEFSGGTSGLWIFIGRSQRAYRTDQVFAAVFLIAILSIVLFLLVRWMAHISTPWNRVGSDADLREQVK